MAFESKHEAVQGELIATPRPHLIVDNFLDDAILAQSLQEIGRDTYAYDIEYRGTGRIEFSLLKSECLWRAIYSRRTLSLLASAFEVAVSLNKDNMLQLRRMNEESPEFPMHNDFASSEDTIASFLYLSCGWSKPCSGCLRLYRSESDGAPTASIAPIQNRLIAFRTKPYTGIPSRGCTVGKD